MNKLFPYLSLLLIFFVCGCKQEKKVNTASIIEQQPFPFNLIGEELPSSIDRNLSFKNLQEITIDLNDDGLIDTVTVDRIRSLVRDDGTLYIWDDPGDFHRISISIQGKPKWCSINTDGWVRNQSLLNYDGELLKESLAHSQYLIIRDEGHGNLLIYAAGYAYASSPGLLTIVSVYKGEEVRLAYNENRELLSMKDINGDGINDLITTVWDGFYSNREQNNYRHKVYLVNGGFSFSPSFSKQFCEQETQ